MLRNILRVLFLGCLCNGGTVAQADTRALDDTLPLVPRLARFPTPNAIVNDVAQNAGHASSVLHAHVATALANRPAYQMTRIEQLPGLERRTYRMTSQHWPTDGSGTPSAWRHTVVIAIPTDAWRKRALLLVNTGAGGAPDATHAEFSPEMAESIARATRTTVVSVDHVLDQNLPLDAAAATASDENIARNWAAFLETERHGRPRVMPLQAAMTVAVSQTMTLAQRELSRWEIDRFVVSGIAQGGSAAWLSAITDNRVDAIAPIAFDMVDTEMGWRHLHRTYGQRWPAAFEPYARHDIDAQIGTPELAALMRIVDPFTYRQSPYQTRLSIPKYLINAPGDASHAVDATSRYFNILPGRNMLRMTPNADPSGMRDVAGQALVSFLKRLQGNVALPSVDGRSTLTANGAEWHIQFSESPMRAVMWHANNTQARDFRHACGVRFAPVALPLAPGGALSVIFSLTQPTSGWGAVFVEATFADGLVVTTPVIVLPTHYPDTPPDQAGAPCTTLPPRDD